MLKNEEYIDLDKIQVTPQNGHGSAGLPKEEKITAPMKKEKTITKKKKVVVKKRVRTQNKVNKSKKIMPRNKILVYSIIGLIVIAILAITLPMLLKPNQEKEEGNVLLINDENLNLEEITTRAEWFRLVNGMPLTDEQALNLSIDIELLNQEAKKRNITTSDEEIEDVFDDMSNGSGLSREELKEYIEGLGINYTLLQIMIKKEITASKVIEIVTETTEPTEEELLNFYEENKQLFVHDELVKIRQIQIDINQLTEEETYQAALEIKNEIKEDKSNFCELLNVHTDDWSSLSNCGEYFVEAGTSQDEFSQASLEMDDDEIKLIKSETGYHIIWKIETIQPGVSSYEEVKEMINHRLITTNMENAYLNFLTELRANAKIENKTEQISVSELINEEIETDIESEIEIEIQETQELDEEDNENENNQNETEVLIEEEVDTQEPVTEVVEQTEEKENTNNSYAQLADVELRLAKCLTEKGAKMYNVYWSPDGKKQKEIFGEYAQYITTIECDSQGMNPKVAECKTVLKKEFPTWPTWVINEEIHEGYQNLNNLIKISGCLN